jgi:hypothetical protein
LPSNELTLGKTGLVGTSAKDTRLVWGRAARAGVTQVTMHAIDFILATLPLQSWQSPGASVLMPDAMVILTAIWFA